MSVDIEAIAVQMEAAIKNKVVTRFMYAKPGEEEEARRAVPYEMDISKDGNRFVRCYDLDRGETRAFRLDRFTKESILYFHPEDFISAEKWEAINEMYLTA